MNCRIIAGFLLTVASCNWSFAGPFLVTKIADKNTVAPSSVLTFHGFGDVSIDNGNVAFIGEFQGVTQQGIYFGNQGALQRVVDGNVPVPGGTGNFNLYGSAVSLSGAYVSFWGQHDGSLPGSVQGVFQWSNGSLHVVADANTPYPTGGNFGGFGSAPTSSSGTSVFFVGHPSGNIDGICLKAGGIISVIADSNTPVPGGFGNFNLAVPDLFVDGSTAVFTARDLGNPLNGENGIYRYKNGVLSKVVDSGTAIPAGIGNFRGLHTVGLSGDSVAFTANNGNGIFGLYQWTNGVITRLVDSTTPIPGGVGNFTQLGYASMEGEHFAFRGLGANGQDGIYSNLQGPLSEVVDLNDTLGGRSVAYYTFGVEGLSGNSIAFIARFDDDNTAGVFVATLPEPSTIILMAIAGLGLFVVRFRLNGL